MYFKNQRKAFSMITAIIVIILMATVAMSTMNLSGKMVKETTAQYQNEQAVLLAKSYTEYAILAVTGINRSSTCLSTIKGSYGDYDARIHISYIGTTAEIGTCAATRKLGTVPAGSETPLTIIIDAYIDYSDLDNANQTMTYHRRTVQKI